MVDFAATYLPLDNFVYETVSLTIVATDQTHIRVTFSRNVENTPELNDVSNYTIVPILNVVSATPEIGVYRPNYVDLEVGPQTDGVTYSITIETLV